MAHAEPKPPDDLDNMNADLVVPKGDRARVKNALAMRLYGASYADIADIESYESAGAAQRAVESALAAAPTKADREKLLRLTDARLDRLLRPQMAKALDPNHPEQQTASRTALAIIDRQAKLHGLDQPVQVAITNPSLQRIEEWVSKAQALSASSYPEEAEIIEGEIVADGPELAGETG